MEIREATSADADAIAAVAGASWHAAYDDLLGSEIVAETVDSWYDVESLRAGIREAAGAGAACFVVAAVDGEIVGFANAGPARDRQADPDGPDAFLSRLYVAPDRWGEGIGTDLLASVTRRLRDAGHERLRLEVFAGNERGRSFYGSQGFERVGSETETFGGREVETLQLSARLSDPLAVPDTE